MDKGPKLRKVLVAVDGSKPSENALKYAVFTAASFGAELVAVYVLEEEKVGYWLFIDEHFKKELLAKAQEILAQAKAVAKERGLAVKTEVLQGAKPYEEIVKYIEKDPEITTVIMGDHGLGLSDRHLLGSTTERVIRLIARHGIPVAVTVVPYVDADSTACNLYAGPLCT
ncbi:MAG: universal stress protein [Deltaproteobacteria bacterium]|nr:universal stress protein [Deltaproteobacteria bacterium]